MTVPTGALIFVEAVCIDGGCDHDAQAWREGNMGREVVISEDSCQVMKKKKKKTMTNKHREILTGKELEDARDGEPLAFLKGEELSHKHKDAQDAEYASEHRAGLHCLEVICRGSQRESNMISNAGCGCVASCCC